ncbi:MAG: hypothetical protein C4293_00420 [Nitrospiraceae bacterium]
MPKSLQPILFRRPLALREKTDGTHGKVYLRRFRVFIGGFGGPNYGVRWARGKLRYRIDNNPCKLKIEPSSAEWKKFWYSVGRCGLWNWEARYDNEEVCDGTRGEIDIQIGRRIVRSWGSNAYPGGDSLQYSPAFRQFLDAVQELLGGRRFG